MEYKTIDVFKFIAAIMVVFIHSNTVGFYYWSKFIFSYTQFAVPFFFMVSGFFFCKKLRLSKKPFSFLLNYEKRLLLLYLIWAVVSLPQEINLYANVLYSDKSVLFIIFVILRRILLCGEGAFWYILVMAESAIVLYILFRMKKKWILPLLILVGLLFGLIYDNIAFFDYPILIKLRDVFYFIFSWSNNFIMKGIPFMGMGYIISRIEVSNQILNFFLSSLAFVASSVLNGLLFDNNIMFYGLFIIQAISFFMLSLSIKIDFPDKLFIIIRELSSSIYFLHTFLLYYIIDTFIGKEVFVPYKVLIVVLVCSMIYLIIKVINNWKKTPVLCFVLNIKYDMK